MSKQDPVLEPQLNSTQLDWVGYIPNFSCHPPGQVPKKLKQSETNVTNQIRLTKCDYLNVTNRKYVQRYFANNKMRLRTN